jgi:HK97 family phage portal protein
MGMIDNILQRFGYKREAKDLQRWHYDTADAQQWTLPDPYIYAKMDEFYRLNHNLGAALDMLASDVAEAKFNVYRVSGEEEKDIPNHDFERLMENPNPLHTGSELVSATVRDYVLNGNAAWYINRTSWADKPRELWYMPFHRLKPIPDGKMYLKGYLYNPGNGKEEILLPTWQIVHFKHYNPFHDFVGLSPIESIADTLASDIGMRKAQRQTYVQNLGEPPSILAFRDYIQDDAWQEVRRKVDESARDNNMLMLRGVGEAVTWMSRAMSNKDMDFVNQLRQNTTDIFNRVAPGAMAMLEAGANRSTADAARATYSETVWRYMQIIAKKVTKELLYVYAWGDNLRGAFDDPRIVDRQLEIVEIAEFAKYHTIEEVRQEKYKDDPLGDERDKLFAVQVNAQTGSAAPQAPQPMTQQNQPKTMDNPVPVDASAPIDASAQKTIDALYKWRRQVKNGRIEKALQFTNPDIPSKMESAIKARLKVLQGDDALRMFDGHIEALKPKPKIDPLYVLKGLEQTVKAIEMTQKGL